MSVIDDFSALYTAITGEPATEAVVQTIQATCDLVGDGDEAFPGYLRAIARDAVVRRTHGPIEVPEQERGASCLLDQLAPALPGSELRCEVGEDVFVLPSLRLASIITRGQVETYSIVPWSEPPSASNNEHSELVILNDFDPSLERVREWAYSPNLRLAAQDEGLILSHRSYMPLLIELAADPNCPKRSYLLAIADGYVGSIQRSGYDRELLQRCQQQAAQATIPDLQAWAQDLAFLLDYLEGQGPVTRDTARRLTRIVLTGRYRPTLSVQEGIVQEGAIAAWWEFVACFPDNHQPIDRLYVCSVSGALVWSRDALTAAALSPHMNPVKRDDPLQR